MELNFGRLSRTVTALSLAVGLSFGGAIAIGAQVDDRADSSRAYLYQGTTNDIANGTVIEELDDLDDYVGSDDLDDSDDFSEDDLNDDDELNDDDDLDDDSISDDDDLDDNGVNDDDDMTDDDGIYDDDVNDDVDDDVYENDDLDDDVYETDDSDDGVYEDDAVDDDVYENDDVYEDDVDDDVDDVDDSDDDGADDFLGSGVTFQMADDDDHWAVLGEGQDAPANLMTTEDEIDNDNGLTVQTLVDGDYMIVIHEDGDTTSPVLAAGDIEGVVTDGSVLVELAEVDGSGFEGRAFIEPEDGDDLYELDVTVGIFPVGSVMPFDAAVPTPRG